jgi:mannose-6-phosphate isomerase-like protein (cupin superfamily)
MNKVVLKDAFASFHEHWSPRIVGDVDGCHVKVVKLRGEFTWHRHEHEDELFLVVAGSLRMQFRERTIVLAPG